MRNVFTGALLSNYRQHGEKEGAQKKETERKTIIEIKKREREEVKNLMRESLSRSKWKMQVKDRKANLKKAGG